MASALKFNIAQVEKNGPCSKLLVDGYVSNKHSKFGIYKDDNKEWIIIHLVTGCRVRTAHNKFKTIADNLDFITFLELTVADAVVALDKLNWGETQLPKKNNKLRDDFIKCIKTYKPQ